MEVSPERYAPHLSEFYSMMNDKANTNLNEAPKTTSMDEPAPSVGTSTPRNLRRPSSIRSGLSAFSMTDLRALVSKEDIKKTEHGVRSLKDKISKYSEKLDELAQFSTEIAYELEDMARLKGCSDLTADKFVNASGLFHLVSNHDRIISNCCDEVVTKGLTEKVDQLESNYKKEEVEFKKQFKEQSIKLKLQERYNMNLAKRKVRNLVSYRDNLSLLQNQLDQLEMLKHDYYQKSYDLVESTCQLVLRDVATLARAQIEISENIARKGWSGGGLDNLIIDADDPFSVGNEEENDTNEAAELLGVSTPDHSRSSTLTPKKHSDHSSETSLLNDSRRLQSPVKMTINDGESKENNEMHTNGNGNGNGSRDRKSVNSENQTDPASDDDEENGDNFDNSFSLPLTSGSNNKEMNNSNANDFVLGPDAILESTSEFIIDDPSSTISEKS
ncbi:unnamed protein product [Kluyveromyces dobzhanskii CBS 2104]|uniref:WGS project CCBQ000000000 data, contig 00041 n=1 Tax=Kluyveromyces dobzhanskii CBS 2104 TaxID=1427455 RepID=A0A0A8L2L3_9SACH|nr:unnamed protein product [Kluyveromyces dobzhanskii CBS 2104]